MKKILLNSCLSFTATFITVFIIFITSSGFSEKEFDDIGSTKRWIFKLLPCTT